LILGILVQLEDSHPRSYFVFFWIRFTYFSLFLWVFLCHVIFHSCLFHHDLFLLSKISHNKRPWEFGTSWEFWRRPMVSIDSEIVGPPWREAYPINMFKHHNKHSPFLIVCPPKRH
jgi:hypothetical protein